MIPFQSLNSKHFCSQTPEQLGKPERFLQAISSLFPQKKAALKLIFYQHFLNFLEVVGLYLLWKNNLINGLRNGMEIDENDRISKTFFQFLFHYEIVILKDGKYFLSKIHSLLDNEDFVTIEKNVENKNGGSYYENPFLRKKMSSYQFVNQLIFYYRYQQKLTTGWYAETWESLIDTKQLDYEIRLSETLKQLQKLRLPGKINSPFKDSYYTESGRNAFVNFTKDRFISCVDLIHAQKPIHRVLDIGCGYGNYIDALAKHLSDVHIAGIELQEEVIRETQKRFTNRENISLFNQNIFDFKAEEKIDLALLNYVLFYFDTRQKEQLFSQLYEQLADDGSILVCQYYSGIELLKRQLLKKQNDNSASKRLGMYFGNKILYANALWNEASDAFVQSENWQEFETILSKTGFEINAITHADPFYYSLFLRITKKR